MAQVLDEITAINVDANTCTANIKDAQKEAVARPDTDEKERKVLALENASLSGKFRLDLGTNTTFESREPQLHYLRLVCLTS